MSGRSREYDEVTEAIIVWFVHDGNVNAIVDVTKGPIDFSEIAKNIFISKLTRDTLSPLIFLVAFNPLIEVCNNLSTCGFSLRLPIPNSSGLPPVDSAIYVKWDEVQSAEPPRWYYAVVSKYHLDGDVTIEYANKAKRDSI